MNITKQTIITIIICAAVMAGVNLVYAWTGPKQAPPGCASGDPGCDAPINVSSNAQQKTGALRVGGLTSDSSTYLATLSGNVGIGTAAPAAKLSVVNGSQTVNLAAGTNSSGYSMSLGANDDGVNIENNSAGRGFNFKNANGALLSILSGGNVGIGTTNPGTNKLQVNGKIQAVGGDICTDQGGGKCLSTAGGGGGGGDITGVIAGTALTGGGLSGDVTLNLNTAAISACTNAASSKIYWDSANNRLICGQDQQSGLGGGTTNYIPKWTGPGTLGISIIYDTGPTAGNKIGIGTTDPKSKLDVTGGVRVGNDSDVCTPFANKDGTIRFKFPGLEVCNGARWGDIGWWEWANDGAGNLYSTPGTDIILGSGGYDVGIGMATTDNPQAKLHIKGNVRIEGVTNFYGKINTNGNVVDPPAVSFSDESYDSIRKLAKKDMSETEKVLLFWNDNNHRMEVYVIAEDKFYTMNGDLVEE